MLARKALAGTAGAAKEYVEDVFSPYLYVGNDSTQTITNEIDLAGEGGLIWLKKRNATSIHGLWDTERGGTKRLNTSASDAESTLTAFTFNSNGFTIPEGGSSYLNESSSNRYISWTFRKAKKFFDVVTYTGNGSNRTISHNLGSTPGCIIVKRTDATAGWPVYHRSIGATKALELQITNAAFDSSSYWNNTEPTSTVFTVGTDSYVNANGGTYVAYLFAHDAGGFGDSGSDSIIKCGSYTGTSGVDTVDLGWEPQWLLIKRSSSTSPWWLVDNMRGMSWGSNTIALSANTSGAENTDPFPNVRVRPTPTGFQLPSDGSEWDGDGSTYIYIAIRRGPMKTPTSGTSVYSGVARTGTGAAATVTGAGFAPDLVLIKQRSGVQTPRLIDRLRGNGISLFTNGTQAESNEGTVSLDTMDGCSLTSSFRVNENGSTFINWFMRRAPGFFDVVCFKTNASSDTTVSHNLGVSPELMIFKNREFSESWSVQSSAAGNGVLYLDATSAKSGSNFVSSISGSSFTILNSSGQLLNNYNYVAYLFASVSGVSKIGSYTGNGSSVTVTTGFQPRFILVKRTDSTGNWIVSDSARGLVAGNDPYLLLNSDAAEDTDEDWVDVTSTSFTVNETSAANANVNTGTYLYLAVA